MADNEKAAFVEPISCPDQNNNIDENSNDATVIRINRKRLTAVECIQSRNIRIIHTAGIMKLPNLVALPPMLGLPTSCTTAMPVCEDVFCILYENAYNELISSIHP